MIVCDKVEKGLCILANVTQQDRVLAVCGCLPPTNDSSCPPAGIEVQRPKPQVSSEVELEGLSSSAGTADSPDLYVKSQASDDLSNDAATPDLSPPSSSPPHTPHPPARPSQHRKTARFHRQTAVDHGDRGKYAGERGEKGGDGGPAEIQLLMEEGSVKGGENLKANHVSKDKKKGLLSKGVATVSGRRSTRANGHKRSPTNHRSREHGSSNHRQAKASRWAQSSSSASWTSGQPSLRGRSGQLLEQDEEKISTYELEMKPLQPRDAAAQRPHGPAGERRRGACHREACHREACSHTGPRQRHKNREGKEASSERASAQTDPRPVCRDLTLSPPLQSSPVRPEPAEPSLTRSKGSSVSPTSIMAPPRISGPTTSIGVSVFPYVKSMERR